MGVAKELASYGALKPVKMLVVSTRHDILLHVLKYIPVDNSVVIPTKRMHKGIWRDVAYDVNFVPSFLSVSELLYQPLQLPSRVSVVDKQPAKCIEHN